MVIKSLRAYRPGIEKVRGKERVTEKVRGTVRHRKGKRYGKT